MHAAAAEVLRVQHHLSAAEAFAATRGLADLDPAQRLTRALLLEELARYRAEGVFPKNRDFAGKRPTFIDADGTRCAMAHLMEIGGAADLVDEVARTSNHAYVEELAHDPRFVAWLRAAGLTVEEAARIQPSYCEATAADCVCTLTRHRADNGPMLVWEGTVLSVADGGDHWVARVDAVIAGDETPSHAGTERNVSASTSLVVGQRFLAAGDPTQTKVFDAAIVSLEDGETTGAVCLYRPAMVRFPALPPLPKADAIALVSLSNSACHDALYARDPAWKANACRDAGRTQDASSADAGAPGAGGAGDAGDATGGGCSVAGSSPESLSVLAAVVTALAVRRWAFPRRASR